MVDGKRLQHEPAGVVWSSVRILRKGVWGKPAGGVAGDPWLTVHMLSGMYPFVIFLHSEPRSYSSRKNST